MSPEPIRSIQTLRDRRRRAEDRIAYASWTAMAAGAVGSVLVLVAGLSDLSFMSEALPLLSALVGQIFVGYKLRERSQWAAWGLMATYVASFAVSIIVYGIWSGVVVKLVIGYVYVRGWLGTLDYEELTQQIAEATHATTGDAA